MALLLAISGAALWLHYDGSARAALGEDPGAPVRPRPAVAATALPKPVLAKPKPVDPHRLRIPSLGVDARVLPVKAADRTLVPPRNPARVGWWADGARPGSVRGSALIAGHTIHTGGGALDDLEQLRAGDRVRVSAGSDVIDYRVESVEVFTKGALARNAERLFDQEVPGRLVVITCEQWNGVEYLSNVVVTARPV